jgi:RNA polymerase sigma factor (sigma-70 family)
MDGKIVALPIDRGPRRVDDPPSGVDPRWSAASGVDHSDDDWMLLARSGRPGAFDALVLRHQGSALACAYRYLGHRELARDVVQNTFLEIFRRVADYHPQGRFRAYLHRVLLNQCRTAARSRRYRARFEDDRTATEPEQAVNETPAADAQILARERARQIDRALLGLSDKLRSVVVLHYSGDLSHAEVAETLGIKLGTVKSRLAAALVALRDTMEDGP